MPPSSVINGLADSCATIAARRLEFFVVARRGRVLHRRAIVSDQFGSDVGCLVSTNSQFFVGQVGLQSEFVAIKNWFVMEIGADYFFDLTG